MTQAQMFPMTEEERIAILRSNLASDVEKRQGKRDAASAALGDAQEAYDGARGLLDVFDRMVREHNDQRAAVMADSAALSGVDPITGEVTSRPEPAPDTKDVGKKCPDCMGEGRLSDKTGGGHHRCKKCEGTGSLQLPHPEPNVSVVVVLYPGDDEPHVTKIGEHTRYGELVADYFTAVGRHGEHAKDWTVVAEDELTTTGGTRKLRDVIEAGDYGKRLLVVAADQGSVTGAPAETVAS